MIKVTVRIEVIEDNPNVINHLEFLTRDCENVLKQFHAASVSRLDCNVISSTLVGTHRKLIATFPCKRAKCDISISQKKFQPLEKEK